MDLKYIIFKMEEGIGWIQFNRPDKLNAVNGDVLERELNRHGLTLGEIALLLQSERYPL